MSETRLVDTGVSFGDDTIQESTAFNLRTKEEDYTAANKDFVIVTANTPTITLPENPAVGDMVMFKDATGSANWTIYPSNSDKINSLDNEYILFDKDYGEATLVFVGGSVGWST